MPEPETEHGLRIQLTAALVDCHALRTKLATALRERDEARALKLEEVMGATKRVCDERDAANARADAIELARVVLLADERREKHRAEAAEEALAAARRECDAMREHNLEMTYALIYVRRNHQKDGACSKPDECDECEIARTAIRFRTALAAPAAASGEEGTTDYRCPHGRGSNESCRFCSVTGELE